MSDQADTLRAMVRERVGRARPDDSHAINGVTETPAPRTHTIAFVGAKGGVGTTNLVLNLAVALGSRGQRVALSSLAGARRDFDLLWRSAVRGDSIELRDISFNGPVSRSSDNDNATPASFWLLDAGSEWPACGTTSAPDIDEVVIVTTPEPPSLAAADDFVSRFGFHSRPALRVVVSLTATMFEAREVLSRFAVGNADTQAPCPVVPLGYVRTDNHVRHAVRAGRPYVVAHGHGPAARCIQRIGRRLIDERARAFSQA